MRRIDIHAVLGSLPSNWREQVWQTLPTADHALRTATAILQLTGCRVSELKQEMELTLVHVPTGNAPALRIAIARHSGPDREIVLGKHAGRCQLQVPIVTDAAHYLLERLLPNKGTTEGRPVVGYSQVTLAKLRKIVQGLFPEVAVSIRCYRYACAVDWSEYLAPDQFARALGCHPRCLDAMCIRKEWHPWHLAVIRLPVGQSGRVKDAPESCWFSNYTQ